MQTHKRMWMILENQGQEFGIPLLKFEIKFESPESISEKFSRSLPVSTIGICRLRLSSIIITLGLRRDERYRPPFGKAPVLIAMYQFIWVDVGDTECEQVVKSWNLDCIETLGD